MNERNVLVTGFEPFGGQSINASWESVKRLPAQIAHYTVQTLRVPTVFGFAAEMIAAEANRCHPDVILCVGQAGGRKEITPEVIGINLRESSIPDNAGNCPRWVPIVKNAPDAYFSRLPVLKFVESIQNAGIPARLSYSAGTFVCNDVFYSLLHRYHQTDTLVGFLHVPLLPEQANEEGGALSLHQIITALCAVIETLP